MISGCNMQILDGEFSGDRVYGLLPVIRKTSPRTNIRYFKPKVRDASIEIQAE
jgi:hypothetical protein